MNTVKCKTINELYDGMDRADGSLYDCGKADSYYGHPASCSAACASVRGIPRKTMP